MTQVSRQRLKVKVRLKMAKSNIQETDTKVKSKSKKSKVKDEPLESKVSQVTEPLDDVKVNDVQVDVEIDCRSDNHSDVVNGYIRRKRSI